MKETPEKLAYSMAELIQAVGLGETTIRDAMKSGDLVPSYPNSKPIFPTEEVKRWLAAMPTEPRRAS